MRKVNSLKTIALMIGLVALVLPLDAQFINNRKLNLFFDEENNPNTLVFGGETTRMPCLAPMLPKNYPKPDCLIAARKSVATSSSTSRMTETKTSVTTSKTKPSSHQMRPWVADYSSSRQQARAMHSRKKRTTKNTEKHSS